MKKLIALLLAVCLLSGCSLANQAAEGLPINDELVGMYVTLSLDDGTDIWDADAAGMDPIHLHTVKGEKLYARRVEENGEVRYAFPDGCGLSCFGYYVFTDEEGKEDYRTSIESPELADRHLGIYVDSGKRTELDVTLYATADSQVSVYLNPVYQTPEGEVYALATAPMGFAAASMGGCTTSVSQDSWITMGEETVNGGTVTLKIEQVVLPERYIILEMSEDNTVLKQTAFTPGEMPETYVPATETAYIILEAECDTTVRTVYSPADGVAAMDTYYPGQYGLCIKGYTRIEWEGA